MDITGHVFDVNKPTQQAKCSKAKQTINHTDSLTHAYILSTRIPILSQIKHHSNKHPNTHPFSFISAPFDLFISLAPLIYRFAKKLKRKKEN